MHDRKTVSAHKDLSGSTNHYGETPRNLERPSGEALTKESMLAASQHKTNMPTLAETLWLDTFHNVSNCLTPVSSRKLRHVAARHETANQETSEVRTKKYVCFSHKVCHACHRGML